MNNVSHIAIPASKLSMSVVIDDRSHRTFAYIFGAKTTEQEKVAVKKAMGKLIEAFVEINAPQTQNRALVIRQFVEDVIELYPGWKLIDIAMFLKHIRHRQGSSDSSGAFKIYGNTITAIKFLEMADAYDREKEALRHELHRKAKEQLNGRIESVFHNAIPANADSDYKEKMEQSISGLREKLTEIEQQIQQRKLEQLEKPVSQEMAAKAVSVRELYQLWEAAPTFYESVRAEQESGQISEEEALKKISNYIEGIKNKL